VNRANFIPDLIWIRRDDGWLVPLDRTKNPAEWDRLVASNDSVVTQADDGTDQYDGKGIIPTSSSSSPVVMRWMIDRIGIQPGMNVLEIGTGTGYNAATLAELAAPGHVTSIEIDPTIADHARHALSKSGYDVTVVTGDGTAGYPDHAPYDRVMATASAREVSYHWIEQTRPGGRILVPLAIGFDFQAFLSLTVSDDGTADGRFPRHASFMRLRGQRDDRPIWWKNTDGLRTATTRTLPREPFETYNAGLVLGAALPGLVAGTRPDDDMTYYRLSHAPSASWASLAVDSNDDEHELIQHGPRNLWGELENAYRWWITAGRPGPERLGLTVTPKGQTFWLDHPDNPLPTSA
jgi:protein-L-isoaspartate O-methyltransferase